MSPPTFCVPIVPHTLERSPSEVLTRAIEREDYPNLEDELGDLLFQKGCIFFLQPDRQEFAVISDF